MTISDTVAKYRYWLLAAVLVSVIAWYLNDIEHGIIGNIPVGMRVEDPDRPGATFLATHKIKTRYPIIMVPGFVSTALEMWEGLPCARNDVINTFRQRLFGP